jgi:hypothetical protein
MSYEGGAFFNSTSPDASRHWRWPHTAHTKFSISMKLIHIATTVYAIAPLLSRPKYIVYILYIQDDLQPISIGLVV